MKIMRASIFELGVCSGLCFAGCRAAKNPLAPVAGRKLTLRKFISCSTPAAMPAAALHEVWHIGIYGAADSEIFRQDISAEELAGLLTRTWPYMVIERNVVPHRVPVTWTLWPVSRSEPWLQRLQGVVNHRALGQI
jgi:hypothetical protein